MPKAIRIITYEGPQEWLDRTLEKSIKVGNPLTFNRNDRKISELLRMTYNEGEEPEYITTDLKKMLLSPTRVIITIIEKGN